MKPVAVVLGFALGVPIAAAAPIEFVGDRPTLIQTLEPGPRGGGYPSPNAVYSNFGADQFTGFLTSQGVTVSGNTNCFSDDITFSSLLHPIQPGDSITEFRWSAANSNASATTARMKVRIWLPDGAGGGPGTYLTGIAFPPLSIPVGVSLYSATITPGAFVVPPGLKWWVGLQFDNTGSGGTTNAQLANLGQGIFGAPSSGLPEVGFSDPQSYFRGVGGNASGVNNPGGALANFGFPNGPTANFGWEFIPEPTTIVLLAIGAGMLRRTR